MGCPGLHCPGCGDCGGSLSVVPIIIGIIVAVIVVAIVDAAKHAIAATAVVMTDIMDGLLIFSLSALGLLVIAFLIWASSHAYRAMWKFRGNYDLRNPQPIPAPIDPGTYQVMVDAYNRSHAINMADVVEAEIVEADEPLAIENTHVSISAQDVLDSMSEDRVPVKRKRSLRRD